MTSLALLCLGTITGTQSAMATTRDQPLGILGVVGNVSSVGYTPVTSRVLVGGRLGVALLDGETGEVLRRFDHRNVTQAVISPDEAYIYTAVLDAPAVQWSTATGEAVRVFEGVQRDPLRVALSPDGTRLVTVHSGEASRYWDTQTGEMLRTFDENNSGLSSAAFSSDGTFIVTVGAFDPIELWNPLSGARIDSIGPVGGFANIALSPDDSLAALTPFKRVRVISMEDGTLLWQSPEQGTTIRDVDFSPDGSTVVSAGADGFVKLWNANTGEEIRTLAAGDEVYYSTRFSADGNRVIAGGFYMSVLELEVGSGTLLHDFSRNAGFVRSVRHSPDGTKMLTAAAKTPKLWDVATGEELQTYEGHTDTVYAADISPDGRLVASASQDRTAKIWDADTGALIHNLPGHTFRVWDVAFAPDGATLATADGGGDVRFWSTATGTLLDTLVNAVTGGDARSIAYAPDGASLLVGGINDETVQLWDLTQPEGEGEGEGQGARFREIHSVPLEGFRVHDVAFSPDGTLFAATDSVVGSTRVWLAATGELLQVLQSHIVDVASVAFSPERDLIATGGSGIWLENDHLVRLWNPTTGELISALDFHAADINRLDFSPDGTYLLSASNDGTVARWNVLNEISHDADTNYDAVLQLDELLRVVQLYNAGEYICAAEPEQTEDGFAPCTDPDARNCDRHTADYDLDPWRFSLSELLRAIQFYTIGGIARCDLSPERYCPAASGS